MSLNKPIPQMHRVIVPRRLTRPKTLSQIRECWLTSLALQDMKDASAELILPAGNGMPLVWFRYRGSCRPEPFWTFYLHVQIDMERGGWIGRLSHYSIGRRAFIIHPCPDGTHPSIARHVVQQAEFQYITRIKISVPFAPDIEKRHFSFLAPSPLH